MACACRTCCFLDTETTGLSRGAGTVAFLVGVGYLYTRTHFVVEQFLMRDYDEEIFVLEEIARLLQHFPYWPRSTDEPLICPSWKTACC